MKHRIGFASLLIALVSLWTTPATAQARDPLNEKEVDQMREVADEPNKRLELMVKFIRERMSKIVDLQADAKSAKDRPMQIHDLLEDVTTLLDEISDNLDMYGSHNADMRKGLILLIEADSEWQLQLRQLKQHSPPEELDRYSFVFANAVDTVDDMGDDARKELQQQNELSKEKKLTRDYSERPN